MSAPTYFRFDGWVQTPTGEAVPGASVAVLNQPADFTSQPGSPLATIYGAPNSNSASITGASWAAQQITFTLSATPPADIVPGSYISVTGANPAAFNGIWLVVSVLGNTVTVAAISSPGTYVSGGTVATSVLPNPVATDGNGHYFFYALPGIYSVQVYGESIFEQDYPDQDVGVIAGGSGSVTSVGLIGDGVIFSSSVTGSPVTSSGSFDLSGSLLTQAANKILAGPTSGSDAAPTFRTLVAADIPSLTFVSSVGLTLAVPGVFTESVSGSPVTGSGTLAATIGLANQSANEVWAGPFIRRGCGAYLQSFGDSRSSVFGKSIVEHFCKRRWNLVGWHRRRRHKRGIHRRRRNLYSCSLWLPDHRNGDACTIASHADGQYFFCRVRPRRGHRFRRFGLSVQGTFRSNGPMPKSLRVQERLSLSPTPQQGFYWDSETFLR